MVQMRSLVQYIDTTVTIHTSSSITITKNLQKKKITENYKKYHIKLTTFPIMSTAEQKYTQGNPRKSTESGSTIGLNLNPMDSTTTVSTKLLKNIKNIFLFAFIVTIIGLIILIIVILNRSLFNTKANCSSIEPIKPTTTSQEPTTLELTTREPTTRELTTQAPTTQAPTTSEPTTVAPTTVAPTTLAPTTQETITEKRTTEAPTTTTQSTTYDPCALRNCPENSKCILKSNGEATCECSGGYEFNESKTCVDINECECRQDRVRKQASTAYYRCVIIRSKFSFFRLF